MLPTAFTALLVLVLDVFLGRSQRPQTVHVQKPLRFELRHEHAVSPDAHVAFSDVPLTVSLVDGNQSSYSIDTRHTTAYRPSSFSAYNDARILSMRHAQSANLPWYEAEILGPNVESRETLLELAKMTNNAYVTPDDSQWYELSDNWADHHPFGWEPDADGFRGYVFATPDNSIVILSIKGTSAALWGSGGPTAKKDKLNDNLLFSCCCARIDWSWTTVCGCYRGGPLVEDSLFYPIATNLYNNLTYMYPTSDIWIIGHSLGGALASLLGATFGTPVEKEWLQGRLHLPSPPSTHHVTHVYHTADPIAMGTCNGILSSCALGGFAMESKCHLGQSIVYDTVSNLSWSVDIRKHGIVSVIDEILGKPWQPSEDVGRSVPPPTVEEDCVECYSWEFGDFPL
ncbi:alpha/beta-hydrolase [Suillus paluster]|uniref:alpha/beta-hydrolase n=1 Tax=Suillus paluster TaxID=48578 RepID=UPI001B874D8C|nr:alpha/beta-hydrolase [Suillus paluster]KAG1738357.1 alpha/beta-hydrolase [Suillus paluster]